MQRRRREITKEVKDKQRSDIPRGDIKLSDRIGRGAAGEGTFDSFSFYYSFFRPLYLYYTNSNEGNVPRYGCSGEAAPDQKCFEEYYR